MGYFYSKFICNTGLAEKYGREGNEYEDRTMYHVEGRRRRLRGGRSSRHSTRRSPS
ncbi:MAG: hypothetical protein IKQ60_05105 [Candidatus Methanomethylophilaceae archaeon]|nr:hypothetical protein [Candidatus Methanomethylophilaceae archaeon]